MKYLKTIMAVAALSLTACADRAAHTQENSHDKILLKGTLDIDVQDGSWHSKDCSVKDIIPFTERRKARIECIQISISDSMKQTGKPSARDIKSNRLSQKYAKMVSEQGWEKKRARHKNFGFSSQAYEKPIDSHCSNLLILTHFIHADSDVVKSVFSTGSLEGVSDFSLIFLDYKEPVCGDQRIKKIPVMSPLKQ